MISAFNSLTLSPALASRLLRHRGAAPDAVQRVADLVFGRFFGWFNRLFTSGASGYVFGVTRLLRVQRRGGPALRWPAGADGRRFSKVPQGFIPAQDKDYLVAFAQLPDAATLDRTDAVIRRMTDLALKHPGVQGAISFPACRSMDSSTPRTSAPRSSR